MGVGKVIKTMFGFGNNTDNLGRLNESIKLEPEQKDKIMAGRKTAYFNEIYMLCIRKAKDQAREDIGE